MLDITFSAGQRVTAAQLQAIVDQVDELTAPGWTSYGTWSTLITATVTNPTQGSSSITALYRKATDSDICHVQMFLEINTGGGFNAGSGSYRFLLPFAAGASETGAFHATINESGVALRTGGTQLVDSTHIEGWADSVGSFDSTGISRAWTTGDWVKISGAYRVAV